MTNQPTTTMRFKMRDGNFFELPMPPGATLAQFMGIAKGLGCVATETMYMNFDEIAWAVTVTYVMPMLKPTHVGAMEPAGSA